MRASRLMSILMLLQARVRVTAERLAEEFGVSVRTIYRDVDELSASGIPVISERGPGGGFQLLAGWQTKLTGLDANEQRAMVLSRVPGAAKALGLGEPEKSATRKVRAAMPRRDNNDSGLLDACFHFDGNAWYQEIEPPHWLSDVAQAMLSQHWLRLRYRGWKGEREHRVAPLGLVQKVGIWYLVAQSGKGLATFRIDAIQQLNIELQTFERPDGFDLASYWQKSMREFEQRLRPLRARVRLHPEALPRLRELGRFVDQAAQHSTTDANGWLEFDLPIESETDAAHRLLALGDQVEVLSPQTVRDTMAAIAHKIVLRYTARRNTKTRSK